MPSAVLFLPCHIIELTNFVTRSDPYTGSTSTFRLAMYPFRGIQLLALSCRAISYCSPLIFLAHDQRRTAHDRPYAFGRLAPYFERLCLRPATPTASSVPRIT